MDDQGSGPPGDGTVELLLAAPGSAASDGACVSLSTAEGATDIRLLTVAFDRSPDECLTAWSAHAGGERPAEFTILTAGECARSAAAVDGDVALSAGGLSIETVEDPGSPVDLGVAITEHLAERSGGGSRPVVCFHTLTDLLEHLAEPRAVRFLHALVGRLRKHGADAHFHLDPAAHDDATVERLAELVDDVVEPDARATPA